MGWFGHAGTEFFFEYDKEWLSLEGGFVLAPQFPLSEKCYTGNLVKSFFENLLPEGDSLDDILAAIHLRNANSLEILAKLGKDLPGVLSIQAFCPSSRQTTRPPIARNMPTFRMKN